MTDSLQGALAGICATRRTRGTILLVALLFAWALTGCASTSYAGIPLAAGAADLELQTLARRAQAGDKHAQLQLGRRFETGDGVPVNIRRASRLYRSAAADEPVAQIYSIPQTGGRASSGILYSGAVARGLPEAAVRWCALAPAQALRERVDCARAQSMAAAFLILSYDISFERCAGEHGFFFGRQAPYLEVRQCIIDRSPTLDCGIQLERALDHLWALTDLIERGEELRRGAEHIRDRCHARHRRGTHLAATEQPARGTIDSPLQALIEHGRGHRRSSADLRLIDTFWAVLCRLQAGRDRLELLQTEDLICAVWRRPGE